jgi:hypothetical protein
MTSDLAAFLTGRLDEDEAVATDQHERVWFGPYPETLAEREGWIVIRQDRLLREVAAKRAILAAHRVVEYPGPYVPVSPTCSICITKREGYQEEWDDDDWPCATIRLLAAVYSDHPGYREEWAP